MAAIAHTPVMLAEVRAALVPGRPDALMVDCTLGEGGHATSFLEAYPALRYVGIDADPVIQAKARERLAGFGARVSYRLGWFDELLEGMAREVAGGAEAPDLLLFDLGISMHHYRESGRGFGFAKDEVLDMRLSPEAPRSAADLVNGEREEDLARIIFEYGEERLSRRIARAIVEARQLAPITTTGRLEEVVFSSVPQAYKHGRIHPATRTFQALRIAVNDELGRASRGIARAIAMLAPGGRLAVITFHSLEDRIAKNLLKAFAGRLDLAALEASCAPGFVPADLRPMIESMGKAPSYELPFRKPLEAGEAEVAGNAASRSAKLRVIHRLASAGSSQARGEASTRQGRGRTSQLSGIGGASLLQRVKGASLLQRVKGASLLQRVKGASLLQRVKGASLLQLIGGAKPLQKIGGAA
jgi:16S rRNA (cytosine1402-N4)-methyltransferase